MDVHIVSLKRLILGGIALAVLIAIFNSPISYDFSRSAWSLPLSGQIIMIDPGHGGPDGGAVSKEGIIEKEVTLAIAFYLRDMLQESGALVLMTRESDIELSTPEAKRQGRRKAEDLKNRVNMINESEADYFISIHLNSIGAAKWRGAQTFYQPKYEASERMAKLIQSEIMRNLENTNRQAKKTQDVYLLKHVERPGVLVEVGFLSNPEESTLLSTAEYQKSVAASIYEGLLRHAVGDSTD
ncbi:N-acetylmuramoyl-L-alanine amidase CwlD [Caldalkalibacillus salinus]|uniref:N-acetylmuramoyl-L-alanine amidase CwlD n=1 Tax=Caldalkalibacillus salinus TaxID=2803787 RepID=UPI0019228684|nr:N-acetylmuramoyl-L-alanine amidase CwlD [Caldalkalibacillus salinus]